MNLSELQREDLLNLFDSMCNERSAPAKFEKGKSFIPCSGKVIGSEEIRLMIEAALDGWLTTGRFNAQFEKVLSNYLNIKEVITVNSGSSANLIAISSLFSEKLGADRIRAGDEVITLAAGFPTTVNPIIQNGAVPVFIDVMKNTYNADAGLLESALSQKTRAVVFAHTLGNPFDLHKVKKFCDKHTLFLVEDCCDALGSTYDGKYVGTFGDISTLSFYPAHHITMGEGGAVMSNSQKLMSIARSIRDWGRDCYCEPGMDNTCGARFNQQLGNLPFGYDHKYTYSELGYNLKITDMQAACGLAQLRKLDGFIERRKVNFQYLKDQLREAEEFLVLPESTPGSDPSWFGFPITLKDECPVDRNDLVAYLESKRIGTRLLFGGNLTKQPYMLNRYYRAAGPLEVTDKIMSNTFWVGVFPGIGNEELDFVAESIKLYLGVSFA